MFADAVEYCKTCDVCQRTKINYGHMYAPLHPLSVPDEVGTRFSMDHKVLTCTTAAGNTAVLVIVECLSGFAHLIPVPDQTADTTARAIVQHIVPLWGVQFSLYSDKAPLRHNTASQTLCHRDLAFHYNQAEVKTFRKDSTLFLIIDVPITSDDLAHTFQLCDVIKLPVAVPEMHGYYSMLATDITTIAFAQNADVYIQMMDYRQSSTDICKHLMLL